MSVYAYTYEYRDEAPDIQHIRRKSDPDATLCDEFIEDESFTAKPKGVTQECPVCLRVMQTETYESSRAYVARELGVDISEVF